MCYSYEASINAFIVDLIIIIIILHRNNQHDKFMSLFIASYAFVQLGEGLIWKYYYTNNKLKDLGLFIITICVALQPVIQSIGGYLFSDYQNIYLMSIIFGLFGLFLIDHDKIKEKLTIGKTKHLSWEVYYNPKLYENLHFVYYFLFLMIPVFTFNNFPAKKPLIIYGFGSLLYSYYNYSKTNELTSYWCYSATIYSLVYYIFS